MSLVRENDVEGNDNNHDSLVISDTDSPMNEEIVLLKNEQLPSATLHLNPKNTSDKSKEELTMKVDHKIPLSELITKFETSDENGITEKKALEMLHKYGENKLTQQKNISKWVKLFKEMTSGFNLMLWIGTGLCFLGYTLNLDDPSNLYLAIFLIIIIFITNGITFQQNASSEALMNSFKIVLPQKSLVIRDGEKKIKEVLALVPGDVVIIKAGEKIPADLRIIESNEMKVDNSSLTGESEPLLRTVECTHPNNYLETSNLAFFGTLCKEGQGKGIVIATGDRTTLGQIAKLSPGENKRKTPLRKEINRLVVMITIITIVLGVIFLLLGLFAMGYPILTCIIFGIGILVANIPEGLMSCITVSLAITSKNLAKKSIFVKNLESVETLGQTSCICTDKTGTLTQNVMSVKHMWFKERSFRAKNLVHLAQGEIPDYDVNDPDFLTLQQAAIICSEAQFDTSSLVDPSQVDYLTCLVIGDATETGIIRFFQFIEDVNTFRRRFPICKNADGTVGKMPFNSYAKFSLTIVEEPLDGSYYSVYIKGAPEKIWGYCSSVINNNKPSSIDATWQKKFKDINLIFGKAGERVLGFARLRLPSIKYPKGTHFSVSSVEMFNFKLANFQFCGLISLMDLPKKIVSEAILECRSVGIKVIMVTGDQPQTAAAIAKEVNIIPRKVLTNDDLMEADPTLGWFEASEKCEAIVVHGDRIVESIDKSRSESKNDDLFYLRQWVKKPYCVFARTTPAQKLQIVTACQCEGFVVASTGDGINDSPAIKQADIGISMNISGCDVTKDAADMILLNDDFTSIVDGIEEGRKIFDNLKKTIVYILTSNMTQIIPLMALIIFQMPLPLSSMYMLVISVGTDIWPATSLAYEEAELDVMIRKPLTKDEHLVSQKLFITAYLQMGIIATAAGFIGYYTAFNYFGFPVTQLFGMASISGYKPPEKDFTKYNDDPYYNQNLYNFGSDCNIALQNHKAEIDELHYDIDWFSVSDGKYDLRKALVSCDKTTGKWVNDGTRWSECDTESTTTHSKIIGNTACYSTDAIRWAQSVYFCSVVLVQWSNIFACKRIKGSFFTSRSNSTMIQGIIFETCLMIFLLFVPEIQNLFGGRPLPFWLIGMPGLPISISLFIWEEIRKYLIRKNDWFLKYCLW